MVFFLLDVLEILVKRVIDQLRVRVNVELTELNGEGIVFLLHERDLLIDTLLPLFTLEHDRLHVIIVILLHKVVFELVEQREQVHLLEGSGDVNEGARGQEFDLSLR